jgi:hypothetical protein
MPAGPPLRGEHHVPALEVRLDVAMTERFDDRAERGHRDALVRPDVDSAEKSDDTHADSVTATPQTPTAIASAGVVAGFSLSTLSAWSVTTLAHTPSSSGRLPKLVGRRAHGL